MAVRKIIKIDEEKCNGCGLCVPNCAEGAIRIIDGKARLVKDSYCDGLGACLGHCPQDALAIVEQEAEEFNEEEAMAFAKASAGQHAQSHGAACASSGHQAHSHSSGGCPGSRLRMPEQGDNAQSERSTCNSGDIEVSIKSQLRTWPVQLSLVPYNAPYFNKADLLITADCVPVAYPNYHLELLKGRIPVIGCPKLDRIEEYIEKLTDIFTHNDIQSITVAFMEVPCCSGLVRAVELALQQSGKKIPLIKKRIKITGTADQA